MYFWAFSVFPEEVLLTGTPPRQVGWWWCSRCGNHQENAPIALPNYEFGIDPVSLKQTMGEVRHPICVSQEGAPEEIKWGSSLGFL